MAEKKKWTNRLWNLTDSFQGDKVVWMILLVLTMISVLAISSSTPLLALQKDSSRADIIREQIFIIAAGLAVVVVLYNFKKLDWIMKLSKYGFAVSLCLLLFLFFKLKIGPVKAAEINGAVRAISVFGVQFHVFEFTKILMIMYLAWAIDAFKRDDLPFANWLASLSFGGNFARKPWKAFLYIFGPVLVCCVLILNGSVSSSLFIGGMMFVTIIVGGISARYLIPYICTAILLMGMCIGIFFVSGGSMFKRIGTGIERISRHREDPIEKLATLEKGTRAFQDVLDEVKQPVSAKIAISEGGIRGKGAGRSTQRYVVPIMFEDYMFSFIVEEYGILGALIVIILYSSLLARGSLIVKQCTRSFERTAIAGLVILISGQAFMHMLINVDIFPLTGQTLPMISHGKSSFIAFSAAFGIILSVSRVAKKKMDRMADRTESLVKEKDIIREELDVLEQFDSI